MDKTTLSQWLDANNIIYKQDGCVLEVGDLRIEMINLLDSAQVCALLKPRTNLQGNILLTSYDWDNNRDGCTNIIKAKLGMFDSFLFARNCDLQDVEREEAKAFIDKYHFIGSSSLSLKFFGLYSNAELVAVASLGRHSRNVSSNRIVMDRLCFKSGVHITGGAGRLNKACVIWAKNLKYDELVTYSDTALTAGDLYLKLGYYMEKSYSHDYFYTKNGEVFSKQSQTKQNSGRADTISESEWASIKGLTRLYNYGKKRWVINLNPENHQTWKEKNSEQAARMHEAGVFKHSHIRGYFHSAKNDTSVYFGSSYELRCLYLLEQSETVASFRRADSFKTEGGWRNPDILVTYTSGRKELVEVKPEELIPNEAVQIQITDSKKYARENGLDFKVWTEADSGLKNSSSIIKWASEFLKEYQGDSAWAERHAAQRAATRKRYETSHPDGTTTVACAYCKTEHTVREKSYTPNIFRNGRYICEREGGHIVGSRPKEHLKKMNPYANEGKKECTKCKSVSAYELFDVRKASADGRCAVCKKCVSEKNKYRRKDLGYAPKPKGTCACGSPAYTKGMCNACYLRERRKIRAQALV